MAYFLTSCYVDDVAWGASKAHLAARGWEVDFGSEAQSLPALYGQGKAWSVVISSVMAHFSHNDSRWLGPFNCWGTRLFSR